MKKQDYTSKVKGADGSPFSLEKVFLLRKEGFQLIYKMIATHTYIVSFYELIVSEATST